MTHAASPAETPDVSRILVIGGCGAGKSEFSRRLGTRVGLPVTHLDREYWLPGWVEPERDAWASQLDALLAREAFIFDGSHVATLPQRLARAQLVIWLDLPTWLCFARVVRRMLRSYGRNRPDAAEGCPERLDPAFLWYVLRYRATQHERIAGMVAEARVPLVRLPSRRAVAAYLDRFAPLATGFDLQR